MSDNIVISAPYIVIDDYSEKYYLGEVIPVWLCEVDIARIHRTVLHLTEPQGDEWKERRIGISIIGETNNSRDIVEFSVCNRTSRNRYYILHNYSLADSYPYIEPHSYYGVFRNNNGDGTVVDVTVENISYRTSITQNYLLQTGGSKNTPYTASASNINAMTKIIVDNDNAPITLPSVGIPLHSQMQFKCSKPPMFNIAGGSGLLIDQGDSFSSLETEVIVDVYYRSIDPLEIELFWLKYKPLESDDGFNGSHYLFSSYTPNYEPGITEVYNVRGSTVIFSDTGFAYEMRIKLADDEDPYTAGDMFYAMNLQEDKIGVIRLLGKEIYLRPTDTVQIVFISETDFVVSRF